MRVQIGGPLDDKQVEVLLLPLLSGQEVLGNRKYKLTVIVAGDAHRAAVTIGTYCGQLCGSGRSYVFTLDDGTWRRLYVYRSWVS